LLPVCADVRFVRVRSPVPVSHPLTPVSDVPWSGTLYGSGTVLPPPPVKRPLQARFFDTAPVLSCTVPQFPLPTPVVKLRRVGPTPQHACAMVVVVVLDVVVVTAMLVVVVVGGAVVDVVVVAPCVVDVVVEAGIVPVLLVVAIVVLVVVSTGPVDVVCVVLVVAMVVLVVVVATPPGQVQSARQSSMAPPGELGGHVALPGGSHCSPGSMNELPQDVGRVVLDEDDDVVVTVTVVVVWPGLVVDVVGGTVVVVVVVPPAQFGPLHASQQLGTLPTQALPSGGG